MFSRMFTGAIVIGASLSGASYTQAAPPGTPLFSSKTSAPVVIADKLADKPAAPAAVAAPIPSSGLVLGACDPCKVDAERRKLLSSHGHKDHSLKNVVAKVHPDKGPKPHCDNKIYPLSEAKYIHPHCGPTICAGSCYGYFPNQWRPWDCGPNGCGNTSAVTAETPKALQPLPAVPVAPAPKPVKPMPLPISPNEAAPDKPKPVEPVAPVVPKVEEKKPEPMSIPAVPIIPIDPPKKEEKKEEKKKPVGGYDIQIQVEPPSPLLFPTRAQDANK